MSRTFNLPPRRLDAFDLRETNADRRNMVVAHDPEWTPWASARPLGTRIQQAVAGSTSESMDQFMSWVSRFRGCQISGGAHVFVAGQDGCIWCGRSD